MFKTIGAIIKAPFKLIGGASKVSGAVGNIATLRSLLLFPFMFMASGNAAAAASGKMVTGSDLGVASNEDITTSFWSSLVRNPLTGESGIMPGFINMKNGAVHLAKTGYNMVGSGITAYKQDKDILTALRTEWNAPFEAPPHSRNHN